MYSVIFGNSNYDANSNACTAPLINATALSTLTLFL